MMSEGEPEGESGTDPQSAPSKTEDGEQTEIVHAELTPDEARVIDELREAADNGQDDQILLSPGDHRVDVVAASSVHHQGPLPLADQFDGYERTLTGAADRILTMAEQAQQAHIELEHRQMDLDEQIHTSARRVFEREQWMTFAVAVAALVLTLLLALWGYEWVAVATALSGGAGTIALARRLLRGRFGPNEVEPE